MKKLLLTVLAAVLASGAFAQEAFPDIPAGHWAGEAVARIADLGIVIGFPDGTFRGNESFTRYQSALVVSRLLDVIQQDMDAMQALSEQDMASLRNALQELASDVAAQGVRLGAVEGSVAALGDDVASNTARLDALEGMDMGGIDPAVLQDLQNQIAAARTAADTAAAQAAAAEQLARGADARSRQNEEAINSINELLAMINSMLDQPGVEIEMPDLTGIERNANDIANLREFVILLRRDQVALRDRVAALEASDAEQNARIDDLDARLTTIEENFINLSGTLALEYNVQRLSGAEVPFDVDRIWGLNSMRVMPEMMFADEGASAFSTGAEDYDDDGSTDEDGERAQDIADIEFEDGNLGFDLDLAFNFGVDGIDRMGIGAFNQFEGVIELDLKKAYNLCEDDVAAPCVGGDTFDGYVFDIGNVETFVGIGEFPLTFQFGADPDAVFTPYVFDADYLGPGYVASVGTPDFLAFLQPELTIAYGRVSDFEPEADVGGEDQDFEFPSAYYRAIRGTMTPLSEGFFTATGGVSFAQMATNARENADANGDNETITVYGVDGTIGISILELNFEYASSSGTATAFYNDAADADADGVINASTTVGGDATMVYVIADVDTSSIPILDSFTANYRDIPAEWFGLDDDAGYIFDEDQAGFKVEAGLQVFIIDVTAYFDSYTTGGEGDVVSFGASLGVEVFRAIEVFGFYENTSLNGNLVVDLDDLDADRDDNNYGTGFGFGVRHDGDQENALLPGLDFEIRYSIRNGEFDLNSLDADLEYTFDLGFLTLTPYVGYGSNIRPNDNLDDETTTLEVGTGIQTDTLDIFLQPSLAAVVNYRNTAHSGIDTYTANELQVAAALTLNEFLFNNSMLTARYGYWTGTNVSNEYDPPGFADDTATNISEGDENGTGTQSANGYEILWMYYGLEFAYGAYSNNNDGVETAGQAFQIRYELNF